MGLTTRTCEILTRLAVGNGALVYRAMDKVTRRQVALKLLAQDGSRGHRSQSASSPIRQSRQPPKTNRNRQQLGRRPRLRCQR